MPFHAWTFPRATRISCATCCSRNRSWWCTEAALDRRPRRGTSASSSFRTSPPWRAPTQASPSSFANGMADLLFSKSSVKSAISCPCTFRRPIMALQIVEKESGGVTILALSGRITLGEESNQLRSHIKEMLAEGAKRLVLDLGDVSYIDSAGLGTLVAGYTSSQSQGAMMKLANLTKRFREQLNITKLVTVFEVFNSVAEAVTSFGA